MANTQMYTLMQNERPVVFAYCNSVYQRTQSFDFINACLEIEVQGKSSYQWTILQKKPTEIAHICETMQANYLALKLERFYSL